MAAPSRPLVELSTGSFIRFGWETFKKRPWFFVGAVIVIALLQWVLSFVEGLFQSQTSQSLLGFIVSILGSGVSMLIAMGYIAFFLKAHDSPEAVAFSDFWHPKGFWRYVGTVILMMVLIGVGFLLLVVPGIILSVGLSFAPYLSIDKGLGPVAALKESMRITKGNRWRLFALMGASGLVMLLGFLALVVGVFVAMPVVFLATAAAYRRISQADEAGEPKRSLSGGEKVLAFLGAFLPAFAVLGILSSIVLVSLNTARVKGRQAFAEVQLKQIQLELELYFDSKGAFPAQLSELDDYMTQNISDVHYVQGSDLENYSYTPTSDNESYSLCSKPVASDGEPVCVTPDADAVPVGTAGAVQ